MSSFGFHCFKSAKISLILLTLVTGCATSSNKTLEIITAPELPQALLTIPDQISDPGLKKLESPTKLIKSLSIGRNDPFLPAEIKGNKLNMPASFIYHGHINTTDSISAFVTYKNNTGTIREGDIGGKNTKLLPNGWVVDEIRKDTQTLKLSFENKSVKLKIFPES